MSAARHCLEFRRYPNQPRDWRSVVLDYYAPRTSASTRRPPKIRSAGRIIVRCGMALTASPPTRAESTRRIIWRPASQVKKVCSEYKLQLALRTKMNVRGKLKLVLDTRSGKLKLVLD